MSEPFSDPFAAFIAPAAPTAQIWRSGLGIALAFLGYFAGTIAVFSLGAVLFPSAIDEILKSSPTSATATGIFFATFAPMILVIWAILWLLHKRGLASAIGPRPAVWRDITSILPLLLIAGLITMLIPVPGGLYRGRGVMDWLTTLPIALILIAIQISAEELLFRGYILQQLAARFRSFWVWGVLPSVIFGLLHVSGAPTDGLMFGFTALFGVAAADVTRRAGNLGPALAMHFANNAMLVVVSMRDELPGFSLFHTHLFKAELMGNPIIMAAQIAMIGVFYLIARHFIAARTRKAQP